MKKGVKCYLKRKEAVTMTESNNPSAIRSKKEITDALFALMQKHPYDEITVKQIILEAKLARKTFYRNFESKDDVLRSHIKGILFDYFEIVNNAVSDPLTAIFSFADKYRDMLVLLDKNSMLHIPLQCLNEYGPYMHQNQRPETNPFYKLFEGLDYGYLMALNMGGIWNVISMWIHRGMTDTPEQVRHNLECYISRFQQFRL